MQKERRNLEMLIPTIIIGILAITLLFIGYLRGEDQHIKGLKVTLRMIIEMCPLLVGAFIVAGMIQVLVPREILSGWIGIESGLRGIFIGTIAGSLVPGGPSISLPIAAGFLRAGASIGTIVAFLTGWSLFAIIRLPMEVGILGLRFMLVRVISCLFFPFIAGLIAETIFGNKP
jgi:uncharacterized membrane protein YraQ (UPF0718 family)